MLDTIDIRVKLKDPSPEIDARLMVQERK